MTKQFGKAHAVSRDVGLEMLKQGAKAFCVDSADVAPPSMSRFRCFNPFHFDHSYAIPVPGCALSSNSIEGVWQGLKVVNGYTDFSMFTRKAEKRPSMKERETFGYDYKESKFLYGERVIDLITARFAIYLPTYLYVLENLVPDHTIEEIHESMEKGCDVYFYDWDSNFDIFDPTSPFSHSAILQSWFNRTLDEDYIQPALNFLEKNGDGLNVFEMFPPINRYKKFKGRVGNK